MWTLDADIDFTHSKILSWDFIKFTWNMKVTHFLICQNLDSKPSLLLYSQSPICSNITPRCHQEQMAMLKMIEAMIHTAQSMIWALQAVKQEHQSLWWSKWRRKAHFLDLVTFFFCCFNCALYCLSPGEKFYSLF